MLERLLGAPLTCSPGLLITLAMADCLSTLSLYIPYTHLPSAVQVTADDMIMTSRPFDHVPGQRRDQLSRGAADLQYRGQ